MPDLFKEEEKKSRLGRGSKIILFILFCAFLYAGLCIYFAWKDGVFEINDTPNFCNPVLIGDGSNQTIQIWKEVNFSEVLNGT